MPAGSDLAALTSGLQAKGVPGRQAPAVMKSFGAAGLVKLGFATAIHKFVV